MRRLLLVSIFLAVILSVLVGGHLYLARRLVLDPALPASLRDAALLAVALFGATLVLAPIAERLLPSRIARALTWPASLWMGFAFFLLVLLAASDALALLLGAFAEVPAGRVTAARVRALGALGLAGAAGLVGMRGALRGPRVRRVELGVARWPAARDGYRIVQLSDIHLGPILDRRFARAIVEQTNALAPDLVAITGDLVDGTVERIGAEAGPLAELRARDGVFFVTGNHDYYSGADAWVERVRALGIRVLRNERVTIGDGPAAFDLAGVEDHHAHLVSARHREDVPGALAGRDPARPVLLLAHDPQTFPIAARLGVDLQLSGHTHGGQIWPFALLVRLATPFVAGHHRRGESQLYVSRGTGFWGPAMRLFATAEITEIVLRRDGGA
jgi:predicted MPP superfamily phosphohydrolase